MDVGARIKELRTERGISTNKLSDVTGISQSYLWEIENPEKSSKKHNPTVNTVERICSFLGLSLAEFFADESIGSVKDGKLLKLIKHLTPSQRKKLEDFLEEIVVLPKESNDNQ